MHPDRVPPSRLPPIDPALVGGGKKKVGKPGTPSTRILTTAETLIRERGLSKASVAMVSSLAGMSSSNIYRFFRDKAAMQDAVIEAILNRQLLTAHQAFSAQISVFEGITELMLIMHRLVKNRMFESPKVHQAIGSATTTSDLEAVAAAN